MSRVSSQLAALISSNGLITDNIEIAQSLIFIERLFGNQILIGILFYNFKNDEIRIIFLEVFFHKCYLQLKVKKSRNVTIFIRSFR